MKQYSPGEIIPHGTLIRAYVQHLLTPTRERDRAWHDNERLMRTTLDEAQTQIPIISGCENLTIEIETGIDQPFTLGPRIGQYSGIVWNWTTPKTAAKALEESDNEQ